MAHLRQHSNSGATLVKAASRAVRRRDIFYRRGDIGSKGGAAGAGGAGYGEVLYDLYIQADVAAK